MRNTKLVGMLAVVLLCAAPVLAQDNIEGPWGTPHGDLFTTARPDMSLGNLLNGMELAWTYDTLANGLNRTYYQVPQIVFDEDGNLYWIAGSIRLASVAPDGSLRWAIRLPNPTSGAWAGSPVVGHDAVYGVGGGNVYDYDGDTRPGIAIGAYDKSDGHAIWVTEVDPVGFANVQYGPFTPTLYNGMVYLTTAGTGYGLAVTQIRASDGAIMAHNVVDPLVTYTQMGNQTFVPDFWAAGQHGLFISMDDGAPDFSAGTGQRDIFGIRVTSTGATLEWVAAGGKAARARLIYSPVTRLLYAPTWNDYVVVDGVGTSSFTVYDAQTGTILDTMLTGNFGYSDTGALMFDDKSVVAGSSSGKYFIHVDNEGDGVIDEVKLYKNAREWFSEPRCLMQLYPASTKGGPYLLTGTSSNTDADPARTSRVVIYDLGLAQTPATDDGPMYVDDVKVYAGADESGARANQVFGETFEGGTFPPAGWADISGALCVGDPTIVSDPTPRATGKVLKLDPYGNEMLTGQEMGARATLPVAVGGNGSDPNDPDPSDTYVIVAWKQWRTDLYDNVDVNADTQAGAFEWDSTYGTPACRRIFTAQGWTMDACLTTGLGETSAPYGWDAIELHYDFINDAVTLFVNGTMAGGSPDYTTDITLPMGTLAFVMSPTPPVAADGIIAREPLVEFDTGATGNGGAPHQRGGPLMGPDGKVYFFDTNTQVLKALRGIAPPGCPGDYDCDLDRDFDDIKFLVAALGGEATWAQYHLSHLGALPTCDYLISCDADGNGAVDFDDIKPFVRLIGVICP